jgi:hypothetical protein
MSENFVFLKRLLWQSSEKFLCMCLNLLESEIAKEFQATEACSSLNLTKAKYGISRLSLVEKEIMGVRISPDNFTAGEKENQNDDENEVYNQYVH